jgi:hypothetical protein
MAASMVPPFSMSFICGNGASIIVTWLSAILLSSSHFWNSTCSMLFKPGTPTFLPLKSSGFWIFSPERATRLTIELDFWKREAPFNATRPNPASAVCTSIDPVPMPICKLSATIADGIFEASGMRVSVTSSPRFSKKPLSFAAKTGVKSAAGE